MRVRAGRARTVDARALSPVVRLAAAASPRAGITRSAVRGDAIRPAGRPPVRGAPIRPGDPVRGDWDASTLVARPHSHGPWIALAALLVALGGAGLGARQVVRNGLPIIGARERAGEAEEEPGRSGVAVCQRPAAHRPCGGIR